MEVLDTRVERLGAHRVRLSFTIDLKGASPNVGEAREPQIGDGPTGRAVPDRIVQYLIDRCPDLVSATEIQQAVGGNPGTVNRQAWTLATNAPDLQRRLRGWVVKPDRGRYTLSAAARQRLGL